MEIQELRCYNLSIILLECRMSSSLITQLVEKKVFSFILNMQISVQKKMPS